MCDQSMCEVIVSLPELAASWMQCEDAGLVFISVLLGG